MAKVADKLAKPLGDRVLLTELDPREFHFNSNDCFGILEDVMFCGHFEDMNREDKSGFCTYPVFKLKDHVEITI